MKSCSSTLFQKLCALAAIGLLAACGPMTDLKNPKSYQLEGLSFQYPKNWNLEEEPIAKGSHALTITTPGNGLVILQLYPVKIAQNLMGYAEEMAEAAAVAIPFAKVSESKFTKVEEWEDYTWTSEKFDITLLGETRPHYRLYRSKDIDGHRLFLVLQSTFKDAGQLVAGLDMIAKSLEFAEGAQSAEAK